MFMEVLDVLEVSSCPLFTLVYGSSPSANMETINFDLTSITVTQRSANLDLLSFIIAIEFYTFNRINQGMRLVDSKIFV